MSKSSRRWLDRQRRDPYVKQARAAGYRSRAAYKLLEIDARDRLLKPGLRVVDLGAAPGGWSQVAAERVGARGCVVALDILPMDAVAGVTVIEGDFTRDEPLAELSDALGADAVDLVLSDMAPNVSGLKAVDQPRSMLLAELALDFALRVLQPHGNMVVKVFHGEGFDDFVKQMRGSFVKVVSRKPDASRANSRETYLVAKGLRESSHRD